VLKGMDGNREGLLVPTEKVRGSKVAERAHTAKLGEDESLADGSVVAMKRGNSRRAKGPCRRHSEREARQVWDDKTHH
jgi:hypothetical protein